ncbi:MAG: hypothetical protein ACRD29_20990 [Acidimicrobiales bacterium]
MNRVLRGGLVGGALALPVVGLIVGVRLTRDSGGADPADGLPVAAAGYIVDPPPDVDLGSIGFTPISLELGDGVPELGGEATAWQLSADVDTRVIVDVARALGLESDVEDSDIGWTVGSGSDELQVRRTDGAPWTYPAATDIGLLHEELSTAGATRVGIGQDEAEDVAREVVGAAGIDLDRARITSHAQGSAWVVRFDPEVDGLPTAAFATTVVVDSDGEIESASGYLARPEEIGEFGLVDAAGAVERVQEIGGVVPVPGPGGGAVLVGRPGAQNCRVIGDGAVECIAVGRAGSGAGVVVDAATLEPPSTAPAEAVDATETTVAAQPEPVPLPGPAPIDPPRPGPVQEPREVTITGAEPALVLVSGVNGVGLWLVPGYLLTTEGAGTYASVAVADEFLADGGPMLAPLPGPGVGVVIDDAVQAREEMEAEASAARADEQARSAGVAVEITLYHCGVDDLDLDGQRWAVVDPPFDATSAPADFAGHGTFAPSGDGTTGRYVDDSGLELTFTAVDERFEHPPCD